MFSLYKSQRLKNIVALQPIWRQKLRAFATQAQAVAQATSYDDDSAGSYQYLQRSKLPTMYFQRSLPRLPIPDLPKTCERFLAAVQPILSAESYGETEKLVAEYLSGAGMDLHARLRLHDRANKHTSYISQPWFDMYLSDRAPLPLNYNPLLVMKHDERPQYASQLVRATNLVISSLRFLRSLREELLEPEVYHLNKKKSDTESYRRWMAVAPTRIATYASYAFKAFPLDMSQFERLFGTTRIPCQGKDELVQCVDARHILVLRRGNMYAVDVLNAEGLIEQPDVLLARLSAVLKMDEQRGRCATPLFVLTSAERDFWAQARAHIASNSNNAELFEQHVDAALFCLCLDDAEEPVYNEQQPEPLFKHLLAGHARNRWFDKSFSLLVSADGTAAINFEHAWGDGVAVLRYFNEIYADTLKQPFVESSTVPVATAGQAANVRPIDFELDERARDAVAKADAANAATIARLDMHTLKYPHINKLACKQYGLSPDSIMQLSFQLAYRQAFDSYVGTYESCSTAIFRHGRTETMRPCTAATKKFCESILQPANTRPSANELRAMIDECSKVHTQLTKNAAMGQGFDRHLFALKHTALQHNIPLPVLYDSDAYRKLNYNIISTSTLSSDALLAGAFGPVVQDGLGIGYLIHNDFCGTIVSSYKNKGNGQQFVESLEEALNKIRDVIAKSDKKK